MGEFGNSFRGAFSATVQALDAKERRALDEAVTQFRQNLARQQLEEERRQAAMQQGRFDEQMNFRRERAGREDAKDWAAIGARERGNQIAGLENRIALTQDRIAQLDAAIEAKRNPRVNVDMMRDDGAGNRMRWTQPMSPEQLRSAGAATTPPPAANPLNDLNRARIEQEIRELTQKRNENVQNQGSFNARDLVSWLPGVANDEQKAESRTEKLKEMEAELAALAGGGPSAPAAAGPSNAGGPPVGTVIEQDGQKFEYQGGDPNDPKSWKPL